MPCRFFQKIGVYPAAFIGTTIGYYQVISIYPGDHLFVVSDGFFLIIITLSVIFDRKGM
ncbi:hypothetical protein [Gracilibacillus phocaeensis]|uniref:hypothetical protein n=1 Tax=Gracilibacillus phocaeensis TaxID=2042304 RepID=UPI0013EEFC51|nr:hypothetical protein [Gracilibacillus phocaeensis]